MIGYGREGRATERVLAHRVPDARLQVFAESPPEVEPVAPLTVGPLDVDPSRFDLVLRSPGVPPHHPGLAACREAGRPMTTSSSIWFAERSTDPGAPRVVGVTGSKGKSTTSALLAHLLEGNGRRVELAGNIGRPLIELLDVEADVFVLELSSYQLVDLHGHPDLGAVTRLFPEHADWHGGIEAYYADKLRLATLLEGRPLWFNAADPVLAGAVAGFANARPVNQAPGLHALDDGLYLDDQRRFGREEWALPGRHNLDNLVLAATVADALGIDRGDALATARDFRGLAHRLEALGSIDGVAWINDSISTSPHATRAALRADPRPAVLIAGGQARSADDGAWAGDLPKLRGLVGLPDTGPDLAGRLVALGCVERGDIRQVEGLDAAVRAAADLARPGDRVLLSPGAPSYHRFRDFEARGEAFRSAVEALRRARGGRD
nr:UDP-N-acetylmuramoyl-L-alanine--D-glutamate ligase [Wenzhouxiangella sp. XN79A]